MTTRMVSWSDDVGEPLRILDVAGGTGDIAFRMAERLTKGGLPSTATPEEMASGRTDIVVCDINPSMLRVGEERATARGIGLPGARPSFSWVQGDAEQLQFESDSFDVYTIAFGIRNVTHVDVRPSICILQAAHGRNRKHSPKPTACFARAVASCASSLAKCATRSCVRSTTKYDSHISMTTPHAMQ